jgi:hypothetical protein
MSKDKPTRGGRPKKNTEVSLVRSSAAEYLTFVAAGGDSEASVEMRYEDENVWLTQKMMAALYDVSVPAINQHLKRIFSDNELEEEAVVKPYLITAADGKNYQTKHYSLQAIIAVGFKIENERAVQFRKWANQIVKDYTIQGWTMDAVSSTAELRPWRGDRAGSRTLIPAFSHGEKEEYVGAGGFPGGGLEGALGGGGAALEPEAAGGDRG